MALENVADGPFAARLAGRGPRALLSTRLRDAGPRHAVPTPTATLPDRRGAEWRWFALPPAPPGVVPGAGDRGLVAPRSSSASPAPSQGGLRRTAELLAALSAGLDAAERRPEGHALRTAYLCCRMADESGLAEERRSELLYAGLLLDAGSIGLQPSDHDPRADSSPGRRGLGRLRAAAHAPRPPSHLSRPDRAAAVVRLLRLPAGVAEAIISVDERWDGRGPRGERRDGIPGSSRILAVASAVAQVGPAATPTALERALRPRRGRDLDPDLVDKVLAMGRLGLWRELASPNLPERMLELEPTHYVRLCNEAGLDTIAGAFADMVDTRTPRMGRHGRRVAFFAEQTAEELGLDPRLTADLRRAALLHDVGKLLVPIAYLEKPGELTDAERRVVDEHARSGAVILSRSRAFAPLVPLMVAHHERLDGNGMFPAARDEAAAVAARVLALCDRYEAMTAERPYRALLSNEQVWSILDEVVGEPMARSALRAMRRAVKPN